MPEMKKAGNGPERRHDRNTVIILFLFSLCIRLLYVGFLNVNPLAHGRDILLTKWDDQLSYWLFAEAILKDSVWLTTDVSYRPPLYPLLVSLISVTVGTGANFINIMVAQSVIGSVTVIIIYYLAKKIFDVRTAMLSAFLASVYPLYLYYCGFILGETLVILLFLLFLLLIVLFIEDRDMKMLVGSGVIFTMLIHTDPRFLFHLPFVPLYLGVGLSDRRNALKTSSILILVVILCSIPWAVRNHAVYKDRFVLINTRTLDTWAKRSVINVAAKSEGKDRGVSIQKPTTLEAFEELKKKSLVSAEYAHSIKAPRFARIFSEEERMAFERGVRPSFSVAGLYLHHFTEFWRFARFSPGYNPYPDLRFEAVWAAHRNLIGILFTGLLYPFLVAGIIFCFRQHANLRLIVCLVIFVHTVLHVIVHSRERYRMPIEGVIFMVAFFGLLEIMARVRIRRQKIPVLDSQEALRD